MTPNIRCAVLVFGWWLAVACGDGADDSKGDDSGTSDTGDTDTDSDADDFPGDAFAPWEGGPDYYTQWENGPSADADFFPIAVWLQAPEAAATATRYRDIGINMHIGLWEGPTEAQLAAADALPTSVIASQNEVGLTSENAGIIKAWLQLDEPDNAQNGTEDPMPPAEVVAAYDAMVGADDTRPVYLNLGQGVAADTWYGRGNRTNHPEDYLEYAAAGDILSFDTYPMNVFPAEASDPDWKQAFHTEVAQNIWYVARGVDRLREWVDYEKPVWVWIETTNFNGEAGFALTPALTKAEVWMAIIHGARGIGYFCHVFSPSFIEAGLLADDAMTEGVHAVNDQISALAAVLNTRSVSNGVTVTSSSTEIPIDTMLKRHAGLTYVFAVSMRPGAATATFTLRDFNGAATVDVLGEDRTLDMVDGEFEDDFEDFSVRIYSVPNP